MPNAWSQTPQTRFRGRWRSVYIDLYLHSLLFHAVSAAAADADDDDVR